MTDTWIYKNLKGTFLNWMINGANYLDNQKLWKGKYTLFSDL